MLIYIAGFFFLSFMLFVVFLVITFLSCLGLTPYIRNFLQRLNIASYDSIYNQSDKPINRQCYICLDRLKNQVVGTCNHSFCGSCITQYIASRRQNSAPCPACRKELLCLQRRFNPNTPENKIIYEQICKYNGRNSQTISFKRALLEGGHFLSMLPILFTSEGLKFLLSNPRVKTILLMLIYTLSPVDLFPQVLFGPIGLADDAIMLFGALSQYANLIIDFIRQEGERVRANA